MNEVSSPVVIRRRSSLVLDLRLDVDDAPRIVEVPPDLADAFRSDHEAKAAWDKLSYQREHAESVTSAKQEATRTRRIEKVLAALRSPG